MRRTSRRRGIAPVVLMGIVAAVGIGGYFLWKHLKGDDYASQSYHQINPSTYGTQQQFVDPYGPAPFKAEPSGFRKAAPGAPNDPELARLFSAVRSAQEEMQAAASSGNLSRMDDAREDLNRAQRALMQKKRQLLGG